MLKILTVDRVERVSMRIVPNFVADISRFNGFQNGGHPPSWIRYAHIWTTQKQYLVVFVIVQTLAGMDAVVSITCK